MMGTSKRKPQMGISARLFGKARAAGASIESAMLAAGYSASTAKKGRAKLNRQCLIAEERAVREKAEQLRRFGAALTPEEQEQLARGRLALNTTLGDDAGHQSAKLLGQDRRVNMFAPENAVGVMILEVPKNLPPLPDGWDKEQATLPEPAPQQRSAPDPIALLPPVHEREIFEG